MGRVLGYVVLAIVAIVGLLSAYQINVVSDEIAKGNSEIKQNKIKNEKKFEQKLEELKDEIESAEYAVPEPVIEDHWADEVTEKGEPEKQ